MKYSCVLADPPWRYENWSDAAHGSSKVMGETMSINDIESIPVLDFITDDAVLAMWTTWPQLELSFAVIAAWGFEYVTGFPWVKTTPSTGALKRTIGFWTMGASELLLIAKRGEPKLKKERERVLGLLHGDQRVLWAPNGRHSAKPMTVHRYLEDAVSGPYLELFARRRVRGWTCWGLETGFRLTAAGVERVS